MSPISNSSGLIRSTHGPSPRNVVGVVDFQALTAASLSAGSCQVIPMSFSRHPIKPVPRLNHKGL
jgi:hypothetical protein